MDEIALNQTIDAMQPPPGWNLVRRGARPDCPGCYYSPSGPFRDATWDPRDAIEAGFYLWGITWYLDRTFTSTQDYRETIKTLKEAGLVEHPQDYVDLYHKTQRDLRDRSPFCSAHVSVDYLPNPFAPEGTYTTGTWHIDMVNPWGGSGLDPVQIFGHVVADMAGMYPSSENCH